MVDAYRAHGLFQRWPIDYVPTHGDGGAQRSLGLAFEGLRRLGLLLARHRRALVHLHLSARGNPAREAAFMAAALAARAPLVLQLHGAGFEQSHGGAVMRRLLARASAILFPCEALRPWARSASPVSYTHLTLPTKA